MSAFRPDRRGLARRGTEFGRRVLAGVAVTGLLVAGLAWATTYLAMTLDEMVAAADIAILGEVRGVESFEREDRPWTRVTIAVERDLIATAASGEPLDGDGREDGGEPEGDVELAFLGGSLPGGPSLAVALMPTFEPGERVLILAYEDAEFASPIVGFRQGLWRVEGDTLIDETGRILGVSAGELELDGTASPVNVVVDALATRFEDAP